MYIKKRRLRAIVNSLYARLFIKATVAYKDHTKTRNSFIINYLTSMSSTSKTSVEFAGILSPIERFP